MEKSITISKAKPTSNSMDYELLRTEAIGYIQRIGGKIWTDFNSHDPGVTILEVLCFAITDLGYRSNFPIEDLLAEENGSLKNQFFTPSQILPSTPVTINDYRKLLMDVEVVDVEDSDCPRAGIKNAWIILRETNEIEIFPDRKEKSLAYQPFPSSEKALQLGILYDVLLEFDTCEKLGDLNENKISMEILVDEHPDFSGVVIDIQIEFPRWDTQEVDWNDPLSIRKKIHSIEIQFQNVPDNIQLEYKIGPTKLIHIEGNKLVPEGLEALTGMGTLSNQVNEFTYENEEGNLSFYLKKVTKINEILEASKSSLQAHRNLCEDFVEFHALRVEEILVCADVELSPNAPIDETEAKIFQAISAFLSPQVNFFSLEEMLNRCKDEALPISKIQQNPAKLWLELGEEELPKPKSKLSIIGSGGNVGLYEVLQSRLDPKNGNLCEISLSPNFPSPVLMDDDQVFLGDWEESQCTPTEKIFEGPLLKHGFIDKEDLKKAERMSSIHVSDLIHIIMDIEGVLAVKSIQIANKPQDNQSGSISSKSVRWCLELAVDQYYVPRLNIELSKITYYKEELPFRANRENVEDLLDQFQSEERQQKIYYPKLDFNLPRGNYRNLEDYESIQNDFPLVYGITEAGLLPTSQGRPNLVQASQLKSYLMVFEQLLVNYLSQLANVRHLFSLDQSKDEFGNSAIDATYFSKSLENLVPNGDSLWKDLVGLRTKVKEITESPEDFYIRKNRFLDHLLARFAEQFTDYGLLALRLNPTQGQIRLIEDKLTFLNKYPKISSQRGKGFDYAIGNQFWHQENLSGLEERIQGLTGIHKKGVDWLRFSPSFEIFENSGSWEVRLKNSSDQIVFQLDDTYVSHEEASIALETILMIGSNLENYSILSGDSGFYFVLSWKDEDLGTSFKIDFGDDMEGGDTDLALIEVWQLFRNEFLYNSLANRKNLSLALDAFWETSITVSLAPAPPTYLLEYTLKDSPFGTGNPLLTGSLEVEVPDATSEAELQTLAEARLEELIWQICTAGVMEFAYLTDPAPYTDPYKFSLTDPIRGGLLTKSFESNFNDPFAQAIQNGDWGDLWLEQEGFEPIVLTISEAIAQGPFIQIKSSPLPPKGDNIKFERAFEIIGLDIEKHELKINGLHQTNFKDLNKIDIHLIIGLKKYEIEYVLLKVREEDGQTILVTKEEPRPDLIEDPENTEEQPGGQVIIKRSFEVIATQVDSFQIAGGADQLAIQKVQEFFVQEFFSHEGTHLIEHILLRPKIKGKYQVPDGMGGYSTEVLEDKLLDPHAEEACVCTLDDPYTCMAHVILPYWAGRFTSTDYRRFLEKKIKKEAPSHVFLTLCWISPKHMKDLEIAWKLWLLESLKVNQEPKELSDSLERLIEALAKIRNVYPVGTLHDCDEGDNLENSIILNSSSLGEF
ncbi:hypothetical protein [Algoriphagus halophilus]|uniref:Baseplate J-like protein n=1 Tax=Algoriphagus halophilus TaxID=226505 RepID=A0A1N6GJ76_9BACT|nr:hypothetical protein [Algoriphagus halophilus]SIO07583.1 hypothetical protein SAMN05444394_3295 [Algoriphagus halophilus]